MAEETPKMIDPIRETDDEARALARSLLAEARYGAIGVRDPESGVPVVTRIAVARTEAGQPLTLVSSLSHHTKGLLADPACSLLLGEPKDKGDPLVFPRITLQCAARFVARDAPERAALRAHYLTQQPKAELYIDFGDFSLVVLEVREAYLNGGFAKAYNLTPADLGL